MQSKDTNYNANTLSIHSFGLLEYHEADLLQKKYQLERRHEERSDTLMLLEHPNVITLGTRGNMSEVIASPELIDHYKVQIVQTDRGGQNTIHIPGQLVGYVLVHLYTQRKALRKFVHDLEQSLIDTLACFDIHAYHHDEHVGVWTDYGKIAAIGISVNKGVTRHGFALNVNSDLSLFNLIVPCGIIGGQITNMEKILNTTISMDKVKKTFSKVFMKQRKYERSVMNE